MKIKTMEDLNEVLIKHQIPTEVLVDVKNRISDWIVSGGTLKDPYIKQQFRYVENVIKIYSKKEIEHES